MSLHCISCGYPIVCPCEECQKNRQLTYDKTIPWKWLSIFKIQCPKCGFYAPSNYWAELEDMLAQWQRNGVLHDFPQDYTKEVLIALDTLGGKGYHNKSKGDTHG